jgi:hypothetical protein
MERRTFLKVIGGLSAMAICSCKGSANASQNRDRGKPPAGTPTPVFLAGINREASEAAIKSAVRAAAEAATYFSWLSKALIQR